MTKFIKNSLLWFVSSLFFITISFAITLQLPVGHGQDDVIITGPTQVESDERTIFDIIQIINDYLWFSLAWVAMVVLIYGWIKLITGQWKWEAVKWAHNMILWAVIAIFFAMTSYAIVKLVVNLF